MSKTFDDMLICIPIYDIPYVEKKISEIKNIISNEFDDSENNFYIIFRLSDCMHMILDVMLMWQNQQHLYHKELSCKEIWDRLDDKYTILEIFPKTTILEILKESDAVLAYDELDLSIVDNLLKREHIEDRIHFLTKLLNRIKLMINS